MLFLSHGHNIPIVFVKCRYMYRLIYQMFEYEFNFELNVIFCHLEFNLKLN